MVFEKTRDRLDWWLVPLAKMARRLEPDHISWASLVLALAAGVVWWQSGPEALGLLLLGWGLFWASGILDVLDGKVAKMTGRTTARGDYLDHAIDRFADSAFILGLGFSPWVRLEVAVFALVFTLLTSYLGTQAQAVGLGRNYAGLLARADRFALMWLLPLVQYVLAATDTALPSWWLQWSPSLLDTMLLYFAVAGALSMVQRFWAGLRGFDKDGGVGNA